MQYLQLRLRAAKPLPTRRRPSFYRWSYDPLVLSNIYIAHIAELSDATAGRIVSSARGGLVPRRAVSYGSLRLICAVQDLFCLGIAMPGPVVLDQPRGRFL